MTPRRIKAPKKSLLSISYQSILIPKIYDTSVDKAKIFLLGEDIEFEEFLNIAGSQHCILFNKKKLFSKIFTADNKVGKLPVML